MEHVCKISGEPATHIIKSGDEVVYGAGDENIIKLAGEFIVKGKTPIVERLDTLTQIDKVNKANVGTGQADYKNTTRALIDEEKLDKAGFPKPNTYFAVGTPLASSGVEAFSRERQQFDALPSLNDACEKLIKQIKSEDRHDIIVDLKDLQANDDFTLTVPGIGALFPSNPEILLSLLNYTSLKINPSRYLCECPGDLRAININHWINNSKNKKIRLRLRNRNGLNEIFTIATEIYTPFDADKVVEIVAQESPNGAKAEIVYDGFTCRLQVLFHTTIEPKNGVVGEIFKVGSSVKTSDTGNGSINHRSIAWRALCLNFTNMMTSVEIGKRKHTGLEKVLRNTVKQYAKESFDKIKPFTDCWVSASQENIITTAVPVDAEDVKLERNNEYASIMNIFAGLIRRELVPVRRRKDEILPDLMDMWEKEPSPTRAGIVNAITRYAHKVEQKTPWEEDDIQDAASDLLYQKTPLPITNATRWLTE